MLLLMKILPLAIGDSIPNDDEHWLCYLKMMSIVSYLFSPAIDQDHAAYIQTLICEHHTEFTRIYPNESIIPKMHFMVHMPRLMLEYANESYVLQL